MNDVHSCTHRKFHFFFLLLLSRSQLAAARIDKKTNKLKFVQSINSDGEASTISFNGIRSMTPNSNVYCNWHQQWIACSFSPSLSQMLCLRFHSILFFNFHQTFFFRVSAFYFYFSKSCRCKTVDAICDCVRICLCAFTAPIWSHLCDVCAFVVFILFPFGIPSSIFFTSICLFFILSLNKI